MSNESSTNSLPRPAFVWVIGAVLFAGVAGVFLLWKKPAALLEVPASELARRDGLLYHGQQLRPFTGLMAEKYPNGGLKSRSMIHDGLLHGLSEGWHTNGLLQVRESFSNGVSHGLREKWHEHGAKMSEGTIVEGKHEGIFRRWHENGALAEEVTMRQGEPDGLSRAFYPSGYLKAQAAMKNGQAVETKSWADGELKENSSLASSR